MKAEGRAKRRCRFAKLAERREFITWKIHSAGSFPPSHSERKSPRWKSKAALSLSSILLLQTRAPARAIAEETALFLSCMHWAGKGVIGSSHKTPSAFHHLSWDSEAVFPKETAYKTSAQPRAKARMGINHKPSTIPYPPTFPQYSSRSGFQSCLVLIPLSIPVSQCWKGRIQPSLGTRTVTLQRRVRWAFGENSRSGPHWIPD